MPSNSNTTNIIEKRCTPICDQGRIMKRGDDMSSIMKNNGPINYACNIYCLTIEDGTENVISREIH